MTTGRTIDFTMAVLVEPFCTPAPFPITQYEYDIGPLAVGEYEFNFIGFDSDNPSIITAQYTINFVVGAKRSIPVLGPAGLLLLIGSVLAVGLHQLRLRKG